jgi:hypothetical protein
MKKLIFTILFLTSICAYSQTIPTVEYFGGIYGNTAYFNWAFHNRDTCQFVVEVSYDGDTYEPVNIRDSIVAPMPVTVSHGYKVSTCEKELWFRVIAKTEGKIMTFLPQPLCENKYTYEPAVYAPHVIHASF